MEMNTDFDTKPTKRPVGSRHHCHPTGTIRYCNCNKETITVRLQRCCVNTDTKEVFPEAYPVSINSRKNWEILDTKDPIIFTTKRYSSDDVRVRVEGVLHNGISTQAPVDHGRTYRKNLRKQKAQQNSRNNHRQATTIAQEDVIDNPQPAISPLQNNQDYFNVVINGAHSFTKLNYAGLNTNPVTKKSKTLSCIGSSHKKRPARSVKNIDLIANMED
eukprot:TRINITY_DN1093_c1_g2_i2.p2 TRINITY_DN1093_c1_g2~~TRINITY_DN1093_c1_g2_i2.p2  ORF type:complete len:217 (-),score=45.56 TRINITY_DN1093_c1_g2_i2:101-751(-)